MSSKISVFAVSWRKTIAGTTLFKPPLSEYDYYVSTHDEELTALIQQQLTATVFP